MRCVCGLLSMALLIGTGCANRSTTPQAARAATTGATAATGGATATGGARGGAAVSLQGGNAGPQAAARMTPEQLDAAMKTVSSTNTALGMKLMSNDLPGAAKDAQTLASTFAEVERFWAQANKADAVTFARQARM